MCASWLKTCKVIRDLRQMNLPVIKVLETAFLLWVSE